MHLDVGPAVRVGQQTVVRLEASVDTGGTAPLSFGSSRLTDVYLLSLEQSLAWPVQDTSSKAAQGDTGGVTSPGKPLVVFPVFGALGEGLSRVQVLVPGFGVALDVPVVTPDQAGFDAQQVVSAAVLDAADKGPLPVEFFCGAADGSFDVDRGQDQVTVSLANDVTFAVDSAELSGQADSVLATVVTELGRYPSGGSLSIVGHTDDVADDAYNQTLSEKRAQAVHGRLGQLTDLSQWQVTVSGKGESEPRVPGTTEEARAANRRVELQVSPAKPEEAQGSQLKLLASGPEPAPEGPVGEAPQGVLAVFKGGSDDGAQVKVQLDQVTRVGSFLVGNVQVTAVGQEVNELSLLKLPEPWGSRWEGANSPATGGTAALTLLSGGVRYLPADLRLASGQRPLLSMNIYGQVGTQGPLVLPVIWADPGTDTVTLDLPGASQKESVRGAIGRLNRVPVKQG